MRCSQSINSNGGYLDLGVAGGNFGNYYGSHGAPEQAAIGYARVIIPLGQSPQRLNCNALYELEIERLKAEIEMLRFGLE
ncbi:MAG TPA: hypothetical protein GYA10_17130 [Alphaproteobacteria bacterium]|nr:hypothetical protein [Alphaproteobacteria bacterium]